MAGTRTNIDLQTIADARQGDPLAMRAIYDALAPVVAGYARGQATEDPDAIANETLFRVLDGLGGFDGDADRFRSWVFTIAHNLIIDDRRRLARRPQPGAEISESHLGLEASAERAALSNAGMQALLDEIRRLPAGQRDVLLLRVVADLSVATVAEIMGKRQGAVKALHRRGLESLRSRLSARDVSETGPTTLTEV